MYIYICLSQNGYNQHAGKANTDAYSLTHTQKSEMETLTEAHGCSMKQSQPPDNLHRKRLWRNNRGGEFGPCPIALRPL